MFENTLNFLGKDASVCSMAFCDEREERGCFTNLGRFLWQVISSGVSTRTPRAQSFLLVPFTKLLRADLPTYKWTAGRKQERFHFNYLCQIWLSSILEDERQRCNTQFSLRKDNFWADNQLSFMVTLVGKFLCWGKRVKMRTKWQCLINRL